MTNKFKRAVRARMMKTGESYQAAFNALNGAMPWTHTASQASGLEESAEERPGAEAHESPASTDSAVEERDPLAVRLRLNDRLHPDSFMSDMSRMHKAINDMPRLMNGSLGSRYDLAASVQRRLDTLVPRHNFAVRIQRRIDTIVGPSLKLAADMQRNMKAILGPLHALAADMPARNIRSILGPLHALAADMPARNIRSILGPIDELATGIQQDVSQEIDP